MKKIILIPLLFCTLVTYSKIRLLTFHYNRPELIEIQHQTFEKFLKEKDDYELIVFNDAVNENIKKEIRETCNRLGIQCVDFPQHLHDEWPLSRQMCTGVDKKFPWLNNKNGSVRHCHVARYALENFGINHDDIVGVIDGDMFLIRPCSIREIMDTYDIIGSRQTDYYQKGYEYAWLALCFFKPYNLPNKHDFHFDLVLHRYNMDPQNGWGTWYLHLDSGAQTYFYLKNNPLVKYKLFKKTPIHDFTKKGNSELEPLHFNKAEITFLENMKDYRGGEFVCTEFHLNNNFLHMSASSETDPLSKTNGPFTSFFKEILKD